LKLLRPLAVSFVAVTVAGCVTLTEEPRALVFRAGNIAVKSIRCDGARTIASQGGAGGALDPRSIRLVSWNIHKQGDPGWQRDLARFVDASDVVLLQEVVLDDELRRIVEAAGDSWVMASSFLYEGRDIGVLTAARAAPLASCTERIGEPLIVVPKSAVVNWYRLDGLDQPLAIVNLHAINFALTLGSYTAQLDALAAALAEHRGPVIFAGDFNTWTDARRDAMVATAKKLGLAETHWSDDKRSLFFGKQLDHILVRGLEVVDVAAIPVRSSDHNPMIATLRVK
jgi:endonuclease/exonuclease/phosphatase (EEP) superfamily protein YafD